MKSQLSLPGNCRVVRALGVGGGAWNVAAAIVVPLLALTYFLLGLMLLSAGSAAWDNWQRVEAFEPGSFLKGLLTFLALILLIAVSHWVLRRRKVFRELRAAAAGEEAAYARACIAEPEALRSFDREKLARWMAEFRRASQDTLLLDEASALIFWDDGDEQVPAEVVLRGVPRTVAVPFIILIMISVGIGVWINSDTWFECIVGLTMDIGAAAWPIYAVLGRERRLGGDRLVRVGQFMHGAALWSPPEAVLKIRRFSLGLFAWFRVETIGPDGVTGMLIVDRPSSRRSLRAVIRLWTQSHALASDSIGSVVRD